MPNPYYNPGDMGLNVVAEIEYSTGSYEFDTRVVWADADGNLYTARDAGCSCPTPFEDYAPIEKLERVDLESLRSEVHAEDRNTTSSERLDFLAAVRRAVNDPASVAFDAAAYATFPTETTP